MQISETYFGDAKPIEAYGPGFFRINDTVIQGPVLFQAEAAKSWGGYADAETLLPLAGLIDVLFIGTGGETAFVPKELRARLEAAGIAVEGMNTPSACRTYNVLLSEGRAVALAALPI